MMRVVLAVVGFAACTSSAPPAAPTGAAPHSAPTMCAGQGTAPPAGTARSGPTELQLAPAFLDQLPACTAEPVLADTARADAGAGAVNEKGDCTWPSGVVCHYHLGVEFVASGVPRPHAAELHCILPSDDPNSPRVFGTHFTCKPGTAPAAGDRAPQTGAACGAGLLPALAAMTASCDLRCCDDGTLTNPTDVRSTAGTLDVRPDFRICSATAELDCAAIAPLTGHSANAPIYGAPVSAPL